MHEKAVNIIIVGYDLSEMESECIESVIINTKGIDYRITYVDNFNTGKSLTRVWNELIEENRCEYVCLLNSDTIVSKGWLDKMMKTFETDPKIGFVGPSTNNCRGVQNTIKSEAEANKHTDEIHLMKDPLSGFCLVFRSCIWDAVHGFDERYEFYGAESIFIYKAMKMCGYKCAWRKDAFVYHIGSASGKACNINIEKQRRRARQMYFEDKERIDNEYRIYDTSH